MARIGLCLITLTIVVLVGISPALAQPSAGAQPLSKTFEDGRWRGLARPPAGATGAPQLQLDFNMEPWFRGVYSGYTDGYWHIWTMGNYPTEYGSTNFYNRLTRGEANHLQPRLNPAATQVAYYGRGQGTADLFSIPFGGGAPTRLTSNPGDDIDPDWSPAGDRIVYATRNGGNYDVALLGAPPALLTSDPAPDVAPRWSPDGRQIAWLRITGQTDGAIWVMNADGSDPRQITAPLRYIGAPGWSPDGSLIGFDYDHDGDGLNTAATVKPDGSDLQLVALADPIPDQRYDVIVGGWSPEGERLLADVTIYRPVSGGFAAQDVRLARITVATGELQYIGDSLAMMPHARSIDHEPPQTGLRPLAALRRPGEVTLAWFGQDDGVAGMASYDLQYQVDSGAWVDWLPRQELFRATAVYSGTAGTAVAFRVRGRDGAGNVEPWPATPDARTTFFSYHLAASITDQRGYPALASLQLSPAPALPATSTGPTSSLSLLRSTTVQTVTVAALGFTAPPATVLPMQHDWRLAALLMPADNLISGGTFEGAGLDGWTSGGDLAAARSTTLRFTGAGSARIGALCADDCLAAPELLPETSYVTPLHMAFAPDGREHITYHVFDFNVAKANLLHRSRLPGEAWSAPVTLGPSYAHESAVTPDGTFHVLYTTPSGTSGIWYHRTRSPAGVWSNPVRFFDSNTTPLVHVNADGRLVAFFGCVAPVCDPTAVAVTILAPGAGWGQPRILPGRWPATATAPDGTIYLSWENLDVSEGRYLATLGPDGSLRGTRQVIAGPHSGGDTLVIAIDQHGTVHMVWRATDQELGYITCLAGLDCGPDTLVPGKVASFQALIDRHGVLHLLTYNNGSGGEGGAHYRRRLPDGTWTDSVTLGQSAYPAVDLRLDAAGDLRLLVDSASYRLAPAATAGSGSLAQTVSIPANMHQPTLSFAYTLAEPGPGGAGLTVTVAEAGGAPTEVFSATVGGLWATGWADLGAWRGKTVEVRFTLRQAAGGLPAHVALDDIALGSWRTPVITAVEPARVPAQGPRTVTIRGANFIGTPMVKLGPTILTGVTVAGDGSLQVEIPPGVRPGSYPLYVVNAGGAATSSGLQVGERLALPLLVR